MTLTIAIFHPQQCCQPDYSDPLLPACSQANPSTSCYFKYERDIEKLRRIGQHFFRLWLPYEMIQLYCQLVICHASPKIHKGTTVYKH